MPAYCDSSNERCSLAYLGYARLEFRVPNGEEH